MILLAGLLPAVSIAAEAASFHDAWRGEKPCFTRSYGARHLAAHPKQRLTRFVLQENTLPGANGDGRFDVGFAFTVRGGKEVFEGQGICRDANRTATCGVEGDGGSFTMTADGSDLILHITRIAVEGERDFSPELGVGGDDRVVRLHRSPAKACNAG